MELIVQIENWRLSVGPKSCSGLTYIYELRGFRVVEKVEKV